MKKQLHGILLLNKENGLTSRRVGNMLSKKFGVKKVGHLGTLDPFATGLMIYAFNEGTKTLQYLENEQKTYVATFKLGLLTSSLDPDGEVLISEEVPPKTATEIKEALRLFVGKIKQIPPLTSAIHVDGKRLYEYARQNEAVEIPEREVEVFSLHLIEYFHPYFKVEAIVSKGTYIRTLGADIGKVLGENITTVALERTTHGFFNLRDAKRFEDVSEDDFISVSDALKMFPRYVINDSEIHRLKNGLNIALGAEAEIIQAIDDQGKIIALCRKNNTDYVPIRGFNL